MRDDAPITVKGWKPENYEHEFMGPVTLTQALANSLNTVSVRLTLEVGPESVVRTAYRLGITSMLEPNASIALGTSEVAPIEMVTAYSTFANGGLAVTPHVITRIRTSDGKALYDRADQPLGHPIGARLRGGAGLVAVVMIEEPPPEPRDHAPGARLQLDPGGPVRRRQRRILRRPGARIKWRLHQHDNGRQRRSGRQWR